MNDSTSKFTARVKGEADRPAPRVPVDQVAAAFREAARPIFDGLQAEVTRIIREHTSAMAATVAGTFARELAERDEIIRQLGERVAALEAAAARG